MFPQNPDNFPKKVLFFSLDIVVIVAKFHGVGLQQCVPLSHTNTIFLDARVFWQFGNVKGAAQRVYIAVAIEGAFHCPTL